MQPDTRAAQESDTPQLVAFDTMARTSPQRVESINSWVRSGECVVAELETESVGYAALTHNFFKQGFVEMLQVHPDFRRRGVGTALMRRMWDLCDTEKLWTSTNLSNRPMQALLESLGYEFAGVINHLDEGDPELIYMNVEDDQVEA